MTPISSASSGLISSSTISAKSITSCEDLDESERDLVQCRLRAAPDPLQKFMDSCSCHRLACQMHVDRRQGKRRVPDGFHCRSALAEQDGRTELLILNDPDDQFVSARPIHHRLHSETVDAGSRNGSVNTFEHRL